MNQILVSSVFVLSAKCTVSTNEILWWKHENEAFSSRTHPREKSYTHGGPATYGRLLPNYPSFGFDCSKKQIQITFRHWRQKEILRTSIKAMKKRNFGQEKTPLSELCGTLSTTGRRRRRNLPICKSCIDHHIMNLRLNRLLPQWAMYFILLRSVGNAPTAEGKVTRNYRKSQIALTWVVLQFKEDYNQNDVRQTSE